jgi:hypothetical protein
LSAWTFPGGQLDTSSSATPTTAARRCGSSKSGPGAILGYTTTILGNPSFPTPNGLKVDPNATGPAYGHGSTRHDVTGVGDEVQIGQLLSIGGAGLVTIPDIGIVLPPGRNLLIRNVYSAGSRTATFLWDEV